MLTCGRCCRQIDPVTRELIFFGYGRGEDGGGRIDCSVASPDGELLRTVGVSLPNPVMIHDCAITEHHTIILDFPLLLNGFRFDDSTPSRFGVMPRHATSSDEICWIEAPAAYAFHVANSWEEETPDGT